MTVRFDDLLATVDTWGAEHAAVAVIAPDGVLATHGDEERASRWASVTKPLTALAVLCLVTTHRLDLDEPAGPPGSTIRHLLAHASGLPFEGQQILAAPGTRRIYSNPGFDLLGEILAQRTGRPVDEALTDAVIEPLGLTDTWLQDRPSQGLVGTLGDLARVAGEFLRPTLLPEQLARAMVTAAFPGLPGVVPGVGRFDDCAWGLGVELHGAKSPHWMGNGNSPAAFGHFGGSGTFLWVDPALDLAVAFLTDREFGPWALEAWPPFADAIIDRWASRSGP
jgi:CubicO group peptidase (beta-lactamase class C family)